jgi:hypothetical protein
MNCMPNNLIALNDGERTVVGGGHRHDDTNVPAGAAPNRPQY